MNIKKIDEDIKGLSSMRTLIQTYEEIAASRMQKIKTSVLDTRNFLGSLYEIYQHAKFSEDKRIKKLKNKDGNLDVSSKSLVVLLTANTGLYGGIIQDIHALFVEDISQKGSGDIQVGEVDVAVVGEIGRKLMERDKTKLGIGDYSYFDVSDSTSNPSDFSNLMSYIVQYDSVIVYHGKFESLLSQVPVRDNITGELPEKEKRVVADVNYIFEPSLESVMGFFESEIMASVFDQVLLESSLSKYASRMVNLDRAVVNIKKELNRADFERRTAYHRSINKKQLDLLATRSLWV